MCKYKGTLLIFCVLFFFSFVSARPVGLFLSAWLCCCHNIHEKIRVVAYHAYLYKLMVNCHRLRTIFSLPFQDTERIRREPTEDVYSNQRSTTFFVLFVSVPCSTCKFKQKWERRQAHNINNELINVLLAHSPPSSRCKERKSQQQGSCQCHALCPLAT